MFEDIKNVYYSKYQNHNQIIKSPQIQFAIQRSAEENTYAATVENDAGKSNILTVTVDPGLEMSKTLTIERDLVITYEISDMSYDFL